MTLLDPAGPANPDHMEDASLNRVAIIIGKRGTGKSVFLRKVAQRNARVLIIDPLGEHGDAGVTLRSTDDLADFLDRHHATGKFRAVFQPGADVDSEDADLDVEDVFAVSYILGRMLLIVDEIDMWIEHKITSPALKKIWRYGRHRNLAVMGATRRPYTVPPEVTALATELVISKVTHARDIDWIEKNAPGAPDPRTLPKWSAIYYDLDEGTSAVEPLNKIVSRFENLVPVPSPAPGPTLPR